ncbi:hypothetical protein HZU67_09539 [Apis mellifera carnica]|nr:hypothetical protein HZU67_09539 [Apis mellifera carnica]
MVKLLFHHICVEENAVQDLIEIQIRMKYIEIITIDIVSWQYNISDYVTFKIRNYITKLYFNIVYNLSTDNNFITIYMFYIIFPYDKIFISSYAYGGKYSTRFNRNTNTNKMHQRFLSYDRHFSLDDLCNFCILYYIIIVSYNIGFYNAFE